MITIINPMLIKPGQMDEFVNLQRSFVLSMSGQLAGLLGGRMYCNAEGTKALLLSHFESAEAQAATTRMPDFQAHLAKVRAMVEASSPDQYAEAYTYGRFS